MKISREWLEDYVDLSGLSDKEIAARLTEIGHAVEATEKHGDDTVFEVEFTANRVDAMSHFGLARELAGATTRKLKPPAPPIPKDKASEVKIFIDAPDLCTRYTGLVIKGVKVQPSDKAIQRRLEAVGHKPINNLVDATNYIMLALGHPLHAFDLNDIAQKTIRVRRGTPSEKITTLDGVVRTLDGQTCVIADAERAVAIGGVIGGANSEIRATTRDVLLECAHFTPWSVRRTAKRLGIKTDASYRFERGVDPGDTVQSAAATADLIVRQVGATLGGLVDVVAEAPTQKTISLREARIREISAGVIGLDYASALFKRLGFEVREGPQLVGVTVPTFRQDLSEEDDLLEEVLRFFGYNEIPASLPRVSTGDVRIDPLRESEEQVRDLLVGSGVTEAITYSFIHPDHNSLFSDEQPIPVTNALTENIAAMRLSLFPGLLEAVKFNRGYENRDGAIFEVGRTYHWAGEGQVRERPVAAFVAFGNATTHWGDPKRLWDYFDARGFIETVANRYHVPLSFDSISRPWLKEGHASVARSGETTVAIAGLLSRQVLQKFEIKGDVVAGEIDLERLLSRVEPWRMKPVSRYPGVPKVLAFLHPPELKYAEVLERIRAMEVPHLQEVGIWDRFVSEGSDEVKTALGMWYQAFDRSLTADEVTRIHQKVASELAAALPVRVIG
jgi:phenylalanyl-tRNA synthetase beta chain